MAQRFLMSATDWSLSKGSHDQRFTDRRFRANAFALQIDLNG